MALNLHLQAPPLRDFVANCKTTPRCGFAEPGFCRVDNPLPGIIFAAFCSRVRSATRYLAAGRRWPAQANSGPTSRSWLQGCRVNCWRWPRADYSGGANRFGILEATCCSSSTNGCGVTRSNPA